MLDKNKKACYNVLSKQKRSKKCFVNQNRKEVMEMELGRLHNQEILSISDSDIQNILEYKISRTEDKRLILEIKMDISNSLLQIGTLTTEKESIQEKTLQQVQ